MEPTRVEETIVKVYYACYKKNHRHMTEDVARRCIYHTEAGQAYMAKKQTWPPERVAEVREMYGRGMSFRAIGKHFGLSGTRICQIYCKARLTDEFNAIHAQFPEDVETLDESNGIEVLGLSLRAYNILRHLDVKTIGDLTNLTMADILESKNCGVKTMLEIKDCLESEGLFLKETKERRVDTDEMSILQERG